MSAQTKLSRALAVLALTSAACSPKRTFVEGEDAGAAGDNSSGGVAGQTAGGAPGLGGGSASGGSSSGNGSGGSSDMGGAAGDAAQGGEGGGGESPEPCDEPGAIRCAGNAQRARFRCEDGVWQEHEACAAAERCDTRADSGGECKPLVAECADEVPGAGVCTGLTSFDCGPDLISKENPQTCDIVCVARDTGAECSACDDGQFSSTGDRASCKAWTRCDAGQYVETPGTGSADRICADCEDGFSNQANAASCTSFTNCNAGQYVAKAGTATADRQCVACGVDEYSATMNATACAAWRTCVPGQYVSTAGKPTANRQCSPCAAGSFSATENAVSCQAWTSCPWAAAGTGRAGTATSNAVCGAPNPYRQFGTNLRDEIYGIVRDASGNFFVAGHTQGALSGSNLGNSDAFLRKLDASGNVLWTKQFGTADAESVSGLTLDANGNVYVSGNTFGALTGTNQGDYDAFVRRFDADGNAAWTLQFGSAEEEDTVVSAVDKSGNVYVAWRVDRRFGQANSYLGKYNSSRALQWTADVGVGVNNSALAVDSDGNAYIVGTTTMSFEGQSNVGVTDAYVRKYNAAGAVQWTSQFGTSSIDSGDAVAIDANGVYVVGTTDGTLNGVNAGVTDAFVRKYTAAGAVSWTRQFGTTTSENLRAATLDASGFLYVAGHTSGSLGTPAGSSDGFVRKYAADGSTVWTRQVGGTGLDTVYSVATDGQGYAYIAGITDGAFSGTSSEGGYDGYIVQVVP